MSFWSVAKNLLVGKPAFEAPPRDPDTGWGDPVINDPEEQRDLDIDRPVSAAVPAEVEDRGLFNERGVKQVPVASVIRVKPHLSGDHMELWAEIRNHSERTLELDKFIILGQKTELDYRLQPDGEREFRIYSGPRPSDTHLTKAQLQYKDVATGDYFRADHFIHYKYESDKTYSITELEILSPIIDI